MNDAHSSEHAVIVCVLFVFAESGGEHAAVHRRQPGLLPLPDPGGAAVHHASHRHHALRVWKQPPAELQGGSRHCCIYMLHQFMNHSLRWQ